MKKKICVITGSRADYGLLFLTMKRIESEKNLKLINIVTGMHLSPRFGNTYKTILKDGFKINYKVKMNLKNDDQISIGKSLGESIDKFAKIFKSTSPDTILILGDRYEIFASAISAVITNTPISHIHGGELTDGAIDNVLRHSITKMSHIHFASTKTYAKRIMQMGEASENVYNVGAPGVENIKKLKLYNRREFEKITNFKLGNKNLLITFHPTTLEHNTSKKYFSNLLRVLSKLDDTKLIFTKTNSDADGKIINQMIDRFIKKNSKSSIVYNSMGQKLYLSAMQFVDGVVGNSSSSIIESPSLKCGSINIGNRQKGRIKAKNTIDSDNTKQSISKAIKHLYKKDYIKNLKKTINPYDNGMSSEKITKILIKTDFKKIIYKKFFDIT